MKKLRMLLMMLLMLVFATGCVPAAAPKEDGKAEGLVLYENEGEEVSSETPALAEPVADGTESIEPQSAPDKAAETGNEAGTAEDEITEAGNEAGTAEDEIKEEKPGAAEEKAEAEEETGEAKAAQTTAGPDENGVYTSKEDVALYIHTYGRLPGNFITKNEAKKLGWEGGSVEDYAPGKCIGGSRFGNYEGLLPDKEGREYFECDIDTLGAFGRGAKRIVFSNDGLVYYTKDHYKTFEQLY